MKMNKEELIELMQTQAKGVLSTNEFANAMKTALDDHIKALQNDTTSHFTSGKDIVASLPFVKMDGNFMTTKQGSVLNLAKKDNPWVSVSDEMTNWAKEFAGYLKNGVVGKFLSESVDSDGGYLVPPEFRAIMIMYDAEPTVIWSKGTVWPMVGEKMSFPKLKQDPDVESVGFDHFAGVSFEWTEEGGTKPETQPEFALIDMIVHELAGYTEITNSLLDDSVVNLLNYLTRMFRAAWYWYTDKDFIVGTGGKRPLGIVNDPNVLSVQRAVANQIKVADVLAMEAALPAVFDTNAFWLITKKARANLRGQVVSGTSDELVLQENFKDISQGYSMTILGKPAYLADGKMPALGSAGDLIYGDWKQYYIGFREDFAIDSSRHFKFRNNRTALRCSGRVDGQAAIPQAFVILNDPA